MSSKKYVAVPAALALSFVYAVPAFAQTSNPVENVFADQMVSVESTIENVSDMIQTNIDSIKIEKPETAQTTNEVIYQPEVTYTVEYTSEPVVTTYQIPEEWISGPAEETADTVVNGEAQAAYDAALAAYNQALAEYEAANQVVETTTEVEVEIVEEVEDEEGNITTQTRTEVQTVTETSFAGDVDLAQANLDAAAAALAQAEANLEAAQTPNVVEESPAAAEITVEETDSTQEVADVTPASGIYGDVAWSLTGDGVLTISPHSSADIIAIEEGGPWDKESVKKIVIEDYIDGIGEYAFKGYTNLTSVTLPEQLTYIGASAFENCTALTSITAYENMGIIGKKAFKSCTALEEVTLLGSIDTISESAFEYCENLTSITIPSGVTTIGQYAFSHCDALSTITLSNSVTTLDERAFAYCGKLNSITLSENLSTLGDYAFYDCVSLEEISIPEKVTVIGSDAFGYCENLTKVTLPSHVTEIKSFAFYECKKLPEITLPETLDTIGSNAFAGCRSLTEIVIPNHVDNMGEQIFYNCESLVSAKLSENVWKVPNGTFRNCSSLKSIDIPEAVEVIENLAFYNCTSLETVNSDYKIGRVGVSAFENTIKLDHMYFYLWLSYLEQDAFKGSGLKTIYFEGTQEDWNKVDLGDHCLEDSVKIYYLRDDGIFNYSYNTLSLEGNIGMNFFFAFGSAVLDDENAKVESSIGDDTVSFLAKDGRIKYDDDGMKYYGFTRELTSVQMAEDVSSKVVLSNGYTVSGRTMSVRTYCETMMERSDDEKLKQLMHDLLNYGGYAQLAFNYNTDDLANKNLKNKNVSDVTKYMLKPYAQVVTGSEAGLTYSNSSLSLDTLTTINHNFKVADGYSVDDFDFMLNGEKLTPIKRGKNCVVCIPNIASNDLDTVYTVTVGGIEISYSALSYAYKALASDAASPKLKNLVRALYLYNQSANAYFG